MTTTYFNECGEELTDFDLNKFYRDMLNDAYPEVDLCGQIFGAGYALAKLDPVAYGCGFWDWLDAELGVSIFEEDPTVKDDDDTDDTDEDVAITITLTESGVAKLEALGFDVTKLA